VSATPGWHVVPEAMAMRADHAPDAHRWNCEPPTQFQAPSSVQAVPAVKAPEDDPEEEPVPVAAGAVAVDEPAPPAPEPEPEPEPVPAAPVAVVVARVVGAPPAAPVAVAEAEDEPAPAEPLTKTPPVTLLELEDETRELTTDTEAEMVVVCGMGTTAREPVVTVLKDEEEEVDEDEEGAAPPAAPLEGTGAGLVASDGETAAEDEDEEVGTVDVERVEDTYDVEVAATAAVVDAVVVVAPPAADEVVAPALPEAAPLATAAADPQEPLGVTVVWPAMELVLTSGPGLGNWMSTPAGVEQPSPVLATRMPGRALNATARFSTPSSSSSSRLAVALDVDEVPLPPIVTDAQFMYISRLPTLLNHVQAKSAEPVVTSEGIVKSQLDVPVGGQPPTYDWMTVKVFPLSNESEA
jgi:hypothetical protein